MSAMTFSTKQIIRNPFCWRTNCKFHRKDDFVVVMIFWLISVCWSIHYFHIFHLTLFAFECLYVLLTSRPTDHMFLYLQFSLSNSLTVCQNLYSSIYLTAPLAVHSPFSIIIQVTFYPSVGLTAYPPITTIGCLIVYSTGC